MKKTFLLFLSFLIVFCTACSNDEKEMSMEQFEKQCVAYKNIIQNIDSTLKISNATHIRQDGDYVVVYSIETISQSGFGITVTFISPNKTEILIGFYDAVSHWNDYNEKLLSTFIYQFTDNNFNFDKIESAVKSMTAVDYYRFDSHSSIFWDDYRSTLYYAETLFNK